jgi:alpha-L-fucosidase
LKSGAKNQHLLYITCLFKCTLVKKIIIVLSLLLSLQSKSQKIQPVYPVPTQQQLAWHEKEFYLFIHFGPNTFTDKEWGEGDERPDIFNPTQLDCGQWARIAKQAGAKGIILTAKHHDGFSLWPSKYSTHTVRESKWMNGKGNVVKALSEACKKEGIEMGVYLSPWDRNHPKYGTPEYNDIYIATMKELIQQYGPFFEFWWDGANGEGPNGKKQVYDFKRFEEAVFKLQPNMIIFSDIGPTIRWCGNEKGFIGNTNWNLLDTAGFARGLGAPHVDTLNQGNFNGKHWIPAEADVSIRPGWFYHKEEDDKVKTPETLFNIYLRSVGNGGNLLLNVPPDRRGLFHPTDSAALMGFAKMRAEAFRTDLFSNAVITTNDGQQTGLSNLTDKNIRSYWSAKSGKDVQLTFTVRTEQTFNAVSLEEMIDYGQRVISFSIEYWNNGQFEQIFSGTTIGRKKIASFNAIKTNRIRITIHKTKAPVVLRSVSAYHIKALP